MLILPVIKEVVKVMIGHRESEKLNSISLSDNTVKRRIEDMSSDVLYQFVKQKEISEDMLFCKALPLHTKGEDIFQCLDTFFNEHAIPWDKCAGVCTDGAAANTGVNCGVVKRVKRQSATYNTDALLSTQTSTSSESSVGDVA